MRPAINNVTGKDHQIWVDRSDQLCDQLNCFFVACVVTVPGKIHDAVVFVGAQGPVGLGWWEEVHVGELQDAEGRIGLIGSSFSRG